MSWRFSFILFSLPSRASAPQQSGMSHAEISEGAKGRQHQSAVGNKNKGAGLWFSASWPPTSPNTGPFWRKKRLLLGAEKARKELRSKKAWGIHRLRGKDIVRTMMDLLIAHAQHTLSHIVQAHTQHHRKVLEQSTASVCLTYHQEMQTDKQEMRRELMPLWALALGFCRAFIHGLQADYRDEKKIKGLKRVNTGLVSHDLWVENITSQISKKTVRQKWMLSSSFLLYSSISPRNTPNPRASHHVEMLYALCIIVLTLDKHIILG